MSPGFFEVMHVPRRSGRLLTAADLDQNYRRDAKDYLEEFFRGLERKGDVKRTFVDGQCSSKPTM